MTSPAIAPAMLSAEVPHSRRPRGIRAAALPEDPAEWEQVYDARKPAGPDAEWKPLLPDLLTVLRSGPVGSMRELSHLLGQEQYQTSRMLERLAWMGLFREIDREWVAVWPPDPR